MKVSIIVAVYNGEKCINNCIDSILKQTFKNYEIVIVNDGSTDRTKEIIESFDSKNIKIIHLSKNCGVSYARNYGVDTALGEYIAILDADDLALPQRIEKQVKFLDENKHIAMCGTSFMLESELCNYGNVLKPLNDEEIRKGISWNCPIANTTLMIRKNVFIEVGGYPNNFRHGEDYRFFVNVLEKYKAANIPDSLVVKREFKTGLTFRINPLRHSLLGLSHRIYAIKKLDYPWWHYLKAISASIGILLVRAFQLNREKYK